MQTRVILVAAVIAFAIGIVVASIADAIAVNPDQACPPGHTIAQDTEGPYYVYTPNLPAGYSAVWVNDTVTLLPPPGTYGQAGDRVIVCYTDDIYTFADTLGVTTTTTVTPPTAETVPCIEDGVEGIMHPVDGCVTTDDYDDLFSADHLATVPSLTDPGRSVADVYDVPAHTAASERPRWFMGVQLPSFARIVADLHAAL